MNTFIRGINLSKKGLKITLLILVALVCATAITLGVVFSNKTNLTVTPETDSKVEVLDGGSLLNANGWNENVALKLNANLTDKGDNVALGNAGGEIVSSIVSLGGYDWLVVYKQNGIITLYANEAVANLPYDKTSNSYSSSAVREYLINEFLPQFIENVGYAGFADMIVPYGVDALYYQAPDAQSVPLETVDNQEILNSNGIAGDKIWLPSALEVGGFSTTATSPEERVNSFKTIKEDGFSINSGLWNLSNNTRLAVSNYALRSSVNDGIAVVNNGLISEGNVANTYAVRPCINLVMPTVTDGVVLQANAPVTYSNTASNSTLLVSVAPDYTDELSKYADLSGTTFTAKTGNTTLNGVSMSNSAALLITLSDAVMAGQTMAGYTFNLVEDVDMSVVTVWNPIGREGTPTAFPFSGTFNGNGYKISGLSSAGSGLVGLFGYVSGATISNVAVVDSSWYTTSSNVGGIAGTATSNSTISNCYNESGISGLNNVGGIVGNLNGGSSISNCYNIHGVAGSTNVGGIVGVNSSCNVSTSYSAGAVSSTTANSSGAIVGSNAGGTYTNCVYYNATQTAISGITGASSYSEMQGKKAQDGSITFENTALYNGWTFNTDSSPWFISAVENDRLPMLKIFLKQVTLNVKANDTSAGSVSVSGATVGQPVAIGAQVTITATANFANNSHYKLSSWNYYDIMDGGVEASTDIVYANGGTGTPGSNVYTYTLTLTMDDSYNLEAIFTKLYSLGISTVFNGFSDTYSSDQVTIGAVDATPIGNVWYEEDTIVNVTIGSNAQWVFAGFTGSTSSGGSFSGLTPNDSNGFVTQAGNVYSFTVGHSTYYAGGDSYYVRASFNRQYNIELSVVTPENSPVTPVVQMAITGGSIVTTETSPATATILYNGTVNTSVPSTENYANILRFVNWSMTEISTSYATETATFSLNLVDGAALADTVTTLHLVATFEMDTRTIQINESEANGGKVVISATSLDPSSIQSANETLTLDVEYGQTVYVYVYPNYTQGYTFGSFSGTTLSINSSNGVYSGQFTVTFADATAPEYDVTYALSNGFSINFAAYLDDAEQSSGFTFSTDPATGLTYNSDISGYTVTVADGTRYFLDHVDATYNGTAKTIITNNQPAGGYQGTTDPQNIFAGLTTQTVAGLISAITSGGAVYGQNEITVNVVFISITRTITVQERLTSTAGTDVVTQLNKYEITGTGYENGQGTYLNEYTITVTAGAGYRVDSIVMNDETSGTINNEGTWANTGTLTFTLSENTTIVIDYTMRSYSITLKDNLGANPTTTADALNTALKANAYSYTVGSGSSTPYSTTFSLDYGSVVNITGYAILEATTVDSLDRRVQLQSIVIYNGSEAIETLTVFNNTISRTLNDEYDNLTIEFNYILLQRVTINLQDTSATTSNAVMVVLENTEDTSDRIVLILSKGEGKDVECQTGGKYAVQAIVPIFISASYGTSGDGSGQLTEEGVYNVSLGNNTQINISIEEALENNSIYGSIII